MLQTISFSSGKTDYHFNETFEKIDDIVHGKTIVIVTDKQLFSYYCEKFEPYKTVVIPAGESSKSWDTVRRITEGLINYEVDKSHMIIAVGGGVITDIAGFVATTYMRGLKFGFVPTSLLGMVDAAVGGKNGVNLGVYKNMMGTIRQPEFILYDTRFLKTLPDEEWSNGFAEIIKYGCIFDRSLLAELSSRDLDFYKSNSEALQNLIQQSVSYKNNVVQQDEQEKDLRKLLNFGHTVGHAIENNYGMAHGKAIAIGMVIASELSHATGSLQKEETEFLKQVLTRYHLPVKIQADKNKILQTLKMDKKRATDAIDFITLERLGKASIRRTAFEEIEEALQQFFR